VGGKRLTIVGTPSELTHIVDREEGWESAEAAYNEIGQEVEPMLTSIHEFSTAAKEVSDKMGETSAAVSLAIHCVEQLNWQLQSLVEAIDVAGSFLPATAAAAADVKAWQSEADLVCMAAMDTAMACFEDTVAYRMQANQSKGRMEIPEGGADELALMQPAIDAAAGPAALALPLAVQLS
jgi:hypothetical protein